MVVDVVVMVVVLLVFELVMEASTIEAVVVDD